MGLALVSSAWFWVTLILCLALLAISLLSIWQHGQLLVFRVVPFDQIGLRQLPSEPALPDEEQQEASPAPAPPPDLNAWPDEPTEPLAQPEPTHRVCMTSGSELNRPLASLHRNDSYRSVSGRESHRLISETARILLEMEEMRNHQQKRASQATLGGAYDNVRGSYASGLDQPTGWSYRSGSSEHRRTPSMRRDWSLPPLPDRVATLPRRTHQH